MLENLHKISLTSIEKAPVTQPNIYSLASDKEEVEEQTDCKTILEPNTFSEF